MRFFSITKPGIIFGNIVTISGGYFLGSHQAFHFWRFLSVLVGMSFIIAAGCVLNNTIDRDIDKLMERTKNRVLVRGLISIRTALVYAAFLVLAGFLVLGLQTNLLTVGVAFSGFVFYVIVYSLYLKRRSIYGTIIGGIAGAVPPVTGYTAAGNLLDMGALILFLMLFLWQIPHFYAISIYRLQDFAAASLPILPLKKNIRYTKISMLLYIIGFILAAAMPTVFGYTGFIYLITALVLGIIWLGLNLQGLFMRVDDQKWARKMFSFSIIYITLLCIMMAV